MTARSSTLIALLLGALATPALANPPVGTNELDLTANAADATHPLTSDAQFHFTPGAYSLQVVAGAATSTSTISGANSPTPFLDSSASLVLGPPSVAAGGNVTAQGFTNYGFDVGGSGDTLLNIIASGSVGASAFETGGNGTAHLIFTVREANNGPVLYDQAFFFNVSPQGCSDDTTHTFSPCTLGFSVNGGFLVHGGSTYDVHMEVTSAVHGANTLSGGTDTLFARIDPQFSVQAPFTLTFSEGFGGGPAPGGGGNPVPEPATWAMLLLGFAGLGAMARTRRRALA